MRAVQISASGAVKKKTDSPARNSYRPGANGDLE